MVKNPVMALKIICGLTRVPFRSSDTVGFKAEERTVKMLKFFAKKGIIKRANLIERFSSADKDGKDIEALLAGDKLIFFQITASYHEMKEYKSVKNNIYYIHIHPSDPQTLLYRRLRDALFSAYMDLCNEGRQIFLFKKIVPVLTDVSFENMSWLGKFKLWLREFPGLIC